MAPPDRFSCIQDNQIRSGMIERRRAGYQVQPDERLPQRGYVLHPSVGRLKRPTLDQRVRKNHCSTPSGLRPDVVGDSPQPRWG